MDLIKVLALSLAASNVSIGASILLDSGGAGNSPAWEFLSRFMPIQVMAVLFIVVGILAIFGPINPKWTRYALWLGAVLMWFWMILLILAGLVGGTLYPSVLFLGNVGILKYVLAEWVVRIPALKNISKVIRDAGSATDE
jgi:hypothetical protein